MIELLRTNDLVLISWLRAVLAAENIEMVVLDNYTSVLEGSAFAIPRRVMVIDEDYSRARRLFDAASQDFDIAPDVILNEIPIE